MLFFNLDTSGSSLRGWENTQSPQTDDADYLTLAGHEGNTLFSLQNTPTSIETAYLTVAIYS